MALLEQEYFTGSIPLLMHNHSSMTCSGPEAFTSTTMFKSYGGETSSGTLHPENPPRAHLHKAKKLYICFVDPEKAFDNRLTKESVGMSNGGKRNVRGFVK